MDFLLVILFLFPRFYLSVCLFSVVVVSDLCCFTCFSLCVFSPLFIATLPDSEREREGKEEEKEGKEGKMKEKKDKRKEMK